MAELGVNLDWLGTVALHSHECGLVVQWDGWGPGLEERFLFQGTLRAALPSPGTGLLRAWGLSRAYLNTAASSVRLGCGRRASPVCGFP